jgi:SAM-dependent methyltransferase
MRDKPLRIFELGIGTNNVALPSNMGAHGIPGASLRGWREYFPHATVFGADIDTAILFREDRIQTFACDQTNPGTIAAMWGNPELAEGFDIMIDDGLHTFKANACFLENSLHKLKPNGYFIIEDIENSQEYLFEPKIKEWESQYKDCLFKLLKIPSTRNHFDNNLLVVFKSAF